MMSEETILQRILRRLKLTRQAPAQTATQPDVAVMGKLLQMVEDSDEVELSCDEVLDLLDQYVELEARGEDVSRLMPLVKNHLDRCRDCFEEYEALARILQAGQPGATTAQDKS